MIIEGTIRWDKSRVANEDGKYIANFILDAENKAKILEACKEVALAKGVPYDEGKIVKSKTEKDGQQINDFIIAKSDYPVKVVDTARNELGADIILWNGSKCYVNVNPYPYNYKGLKGISIGLNGIMVVEMAGRAGVGGDPFAGLTADGFVVDKSAVVVGDDAAADVFDDFEPFENA